MAGIARKMRLLIEGPLTYSDRVLRKGDIFTVGPRGVDVFVANGTAEIVSEEEAVGSREFFELDELVFVHDDVVAAPRSEIPGTFGRHGIEAARDLLLEVLSAHGTRWELRIGGVTVLKPSALIERVRFRKREEFPLGPVTGIRMADPTMAWFSDSQVLDEPESAERVERAPAPGYPTPVPNFGELQAAALSRREVDAAMQGEIVK